MLTVVAPLSLLALRSCFRPLMEPGQPATFLGLTPRRVKGHTETLAVLSLTLALGPITACVCVCFPAVSDGFSLASIVLMVQVLILQVCVLVLQRDDRRAHSQSSPHRPRSVCK